jgi:hypothetical protein
VSTGAFQALSDRVVRNEARQEKSEDNNRQKLDLVVAGIGELKVGMAEIKGSLLAQATGAVTHASTDAKEFERVDKKVDVVEKKVDAHVASTSKLSKILYTGVGIGIAVSAGIPFLVEWIFRGHH